MYKKIIDDIRNTVVKPKLNVYYKLSFLIQNDNIPEFNAHSLKNKYLPEIGLDSLQIHSKKENIKKEIGLIIEQMDLVYMLVKKLDMKENGKMIIMRVKEFIITTMVLDMKVIL